MDWRRSSVGLAAKVAGFALFVMAAGSAWSQQQHTVAEQYLFTAINEERAAQGLPALTWNDALANAAREHANRMRYEGAISHQFVGEPDLMERAAAAGTRFSTVAENVASSDSPIEMHMALMNSPHHRENILDPTVNALGVSVVASRGMLWCVEDFAHDVVNLTFNEQEQQVRRLLLATGLNVVGSTTEARATCRMSTGYAGSRPAFVMRFIAGDLTQLPEELYARLSRGGVSSAAVGACTPTGNGNFTAYSIAVVLYR